MLSMPYLTTYDYNNQRVSVSPCIDWHIFPFTDCVKDALYIEEKTNASIEAGRCLE